MKNIIPLIVAVILGLTAVYLVSRILVTNKEAAQEPQVSIVIAARDLDAGETLQPGACTFKNIPQSAAPKSALLWENVSFTYGQTIPNGIKQGDYIRFEDLQLNVTLANCVTPGKWLIPVTFSDPTLVKMLRPQDEIAIAASYEEAQQSPKTANPSGAEINMAAATAAAANVGRKRETIILFPCVEIIGIANEKGLFREAGSSSSTVFVSLPPRQATILLAAQREAELYPILRRRNDSSARNRSEIGSVNAQTFQNVRANLETAKFSETNVNQDK